MLTGFSVLAGIMLVLRGLTVLDDRLTARSVLERRVREIKRELGGYGVFAALHVQPVPSGAVLSAAVSF